MNIHMKQMALQKEINSMTKTLACKCGRVSNQDGENSLPEDEMKVFFDAGVKVVHHTTEFEDLKARLLKIGCKLDETQQIINPLIAANVLASQDGQSTNLAHEQAEKLELQCTHYIGLAQRNRDEADQHIKERDELKARLLITERKLEEAQATIERLEVGYNAAERDGIYLREVETKLREELATTRELNTALCKKLAAAEERIADLREGIDRLFLHRAF